MTGNDSNPGGKAMCATMTPKRIGLCGESDRRSRRRLLIAFLSMLATTGLVSCCIPPLPTITRHSPMRASSSAEKFATAAFVKRDNAAAYAYLSSALRGVLPADRFGATCQTLHADSFPDVVHAVSFEPMPGQKWMQIFLEGKN